MRNTAHLIDTKMGKNTNAKVETPIEKNVSRATVLAKKRGGKGVERISPPTKLSDKAKPVLRNKFDPIEAANANLKRVKPSFNIWLREDVEKLKSAHAKYSTTPTDKQAIAAINNAIHTIKGNATILGCEAASMLASPLTDLFEGCNEYSKLQPVLTLALNSIYHAVELNISVDDPILSDTVNVLRALSSSCKVGKNKQTNQAAGSASCATGSICDSSATCPGSCPGSGA